MRVRRFLAMVVAVDLALFAALGILVAIIGTPQVRTGVLAGGGLATLNLLGIAWISSRLVAATRGRALYVGLLAAKFALLIGLVYLAVRSLDMNVIWFVVGLSTAGLAVVVGASYLALRNVELDG